MEKALLLWLNEPAGSFLLHRETCTSWLWDHTITEGLRWERISGGHLGHPLCSSRATQSWLLWTVSSHCPGQMQNGCFNLYKHQKEPKVPNNLAHFSLITLISSPFLSVSSMIKLLSSWMGLAPSDVCSTVQTQQIPCGEDEKEMGSMTWKWQSWRLCPQYVRLYQCEVRRARRKALYFAVGAGHARFLLSEPDAVWRLCLKPVLGRHCNPWHSIVLQTLASKVYIHLTVLHFILVLYMRHQTSAVLIKLFESADGKAVTSPLKLLPGKRFRRCFMWARLSVRWVIHPWQETPAEEGCRTHPSSPPQKTQESRQMALYFDVPCVVALPLSNTLSALLEVLRRGVPVDKEHPCVNKQGPWGDKCDPPRNCYCLGMKVLEEHAKF